MKLLLMIEPGEAREILQFSIKSRLDLEIIEAKTVDDAWNAIDKKDTIDLLIIDEHRDTIGFIKALQARKSKIPVILATSGKHLELKHWRHLNVIRLIDRSNAMSEIFDSLTTLASSDKTAPTPTQKLDFLPIKTHLLPRMSPLKSEIYIQLPSKRFLKIFSVNDHFGKADLEKYLYEKKIENLYVRREEIEAFLKASQSALVSIMRSVRSDTKYNQDIVASVFSSVQELGATLGFTKEVQTLIKTNVQFTMKLVGKNPKLHQIIKSLNKDGSSYLASHSLAVAQISCTLASAMDWKSDTTFSKLTLAAFLHDITLKNQALAEIDSLEELDERAGDFTQEEYEAYRDHTSAAAEIAKRFDEIPPDVDVIISQHHERPDGSGFPRGLSANRISPLSAIFIVAHDLVEDMYDKGKLFSVQGFVRHKAKQYASGNFRKALSALLIKKVV